VIDCRPMEIARRTFLEASAAAGVGAALFGIPSLARAARSPGPGFVVKVVDPAMYAGGRWRGAFPDPAVATTMVNKAVMRLAGETDVGRAFARFVSPSKKVGIKINVLGGRFSATSLEVTNAIVAGVRAAGVPDAQIQVFDQYEYGFRQGRYTLTDHPREGEIRTVNHDMVGYSDEPFEVNGVRVKLVNSFLWCDEIISVPVLKDHDLAGITCAMKNLSCGVIDRPPRLHRTMNESIARFYAHDLIRSKVKLIVCDGAAVLYNNGPQNNSDFRNVHNAIYATTDPVAMDRIAHEVIEAERAAARLPTLARAGRPPTFIEEGERLGLGIGRRDDIVLDTI